MSFPSEIEIGAVKTFNSTRIYLTTKNIFSINQKLLILYLLIDRRKMQ